MFQLFGNLDDDLFVDEKPAAPSANTQRSVVTLLEAVPGWYHRQPAPEGLELLQLKFVADRLYRQRRYVDAGHAYLEAIASCPGTNLGFLRDIVDGAARAFHRAADAVAASHQTANAYNAITAGPDHTKQQQQLLPLPLQLAPEQQRQQHQHRQEDTRNSTKKGGEETEHELRRRCSDLLERLEAMASCEDHWFSVASTRWLAYGQLADLHVMIEAEPQSAALWRVLGQRYQADGKTLLAICCFAKAAGNFRASVHECKERFRDDNSNAARALKAKVAEMLANRTADADRLLECVQQFYASLADTTRGSEESFEQYWFPSEEILDCK